MLLFFIGIFIASYTIMALNPTEKEAKGTSLCFRVKIGMIICCGMTKLIGVNQVGLDIYYYDKKRKEHHLGEISEGLHVQIFYGNVDPENWGILRKIKEYYGADSVVTLNRLEIDELIKQLVSIKELVSDRYSNEIDEIVIILRNEKFDQIKFAGD